jgi:ribosome-associated toxin RatA of RatAB toxin-antitoxin module
MASSLAGKLSGLLLFRAMFGCPLTLLVLLALSAPALAEPQWEFRTKTDGISVYNRVTPGSPVKEVKAEGEIDSPPAAVWAVLRDIAGYPKTMPYTKVTVVLGQEKDGAVIYYYTALGLPIISDRDYSLKVSVDHLPSDGSGMYRLSWVSGNDYPKAPAKQKGYVRLTEVAGSWELTPTKGGAATHAIYFVHTDPASPLPNFILNKANTDSVPKVVNALREWAKKPPYSLAK